MAVIIETTVTLTDADGDALNIAPETGSDPATFRITCAGAVLTDVPAEDLRALANAIVDGLHL